MEPPSSGAVAYRHGSHGAEASCRAFCRVDGPGTIDCRPSEGSGTIACPAEGPARPLARPLDVDAGAVGIAPAMLCCPPSNLRFFLPTASSSYPPCLALVRWRPMLVVLSLRLLCLPLRFPPKRNTAQKPSAEGLLPQNKTSHTLRERVMVRRGPMAMNQVEKISI